MSQQGKHANAMKTPFDNNKVHCHTQGLYRFLKNDNVTIADLSEPLVINAKSGISSFCLDYVLAMHDWSRIAVNHANKADKLTMTHKHDVGYELQSSLLVSDKTGLPIAPIAQNLITADGQLSSYGNAEMDTHLNELTKRMRWIESQSLDKPIIHIIDREADSAYHMRDWAKAKQNFLVRVNANNTLTFKEKSLSTKAIAEQLSYSTYKEIDYQGKRVTLSIAEAEVILTRKAKPKLKDEATGKRVTPKKGEPLNLRLICTRLEDEKGQLISSWYLLSNMVISAELLTQFYYYRWQIESYFKLLKGAGHHMEDWLQQSGEAFFKRALIVAQSCIMIWHLMQDETEKALELKMLLMRLSGRQTKRKRPVTAPALLDGYLILLEAYELMQTMSAQEIAESLTFFQNGGFV